MKTILIAINSKFIHPNLAVRYLQVNTDYPVDIFEFTIKDDLEHIIDQIVSSHPDIIGFSVYIWNVQIIRMILSVIRKNLPHTKIILGGPEVSYVYNDFFDENLCDYLITNEGEESFHLLLKAIHHQSSLQHIPNLIYKKNDNLIINKKQLVDVKHIKNPYLILKESDYHHRIQYIELSRGCPYQCSYCLASLEKGLRFFHIDDVISTIDHLVLNGAKTFKFLDRSFNANTSLAKDLLAMLYRKQYPDVVFQFEINGDVLKQELIDFLIEKTPPNYIRFEIGVQSTNDHVNLAVNRYQDTKKLIQNIQLLKTSNITLHLDLIAGLPYEDLVSFKNTFNTIYQLFPDELQLGFLKVLKGTKIYEESHRYQIQYDLNAPYQIIDNAYISKSDLNTVHQVETMLNIYWNKNFMNQSIEMITKNIDAFEFYQSLYEFYTLHNYPLLRYRFEELFTHLIDFLKTINQYNTIIEDSLKYDYLNHFNIKPKPYWDESINRNDILRSFHLTKPALKIDDLYKYGFVTKLTSSYLIILYKPESKDIYEYKID